MKRSISEKYAKLNTDQKNFVFAEEFFPKPNGSDYEAGEFERFFVKKINETSIIEVTRQNYQDTTSVLYEKVKLRWEISGNLDDVVNKNKNTIKSSRTVMPGLEDKLINPSQFFKP